MKTVIRLLIVLLVCSIAAICQTESASISGRVTDPSGSAVVDAGVQVTNVDTGMTLALKTNGAGFYVATGLTPGKYRVTVSKEGFQTINLTGIEINVQDYLSKNFELKVGSVSEQVTVVANALNINTTDASVSTVVDQTYIKNMPLNGRSFQDLILLTPGATTTSPQVLGGSFTGRGDSGEFSINGQRTESNYYTVDGVSANVGLIPDTGGAGFSGSISGSTSLGTTQSLASVDDLREFRVQSSSYSAEYGRNPGGQFAFETKSGNNQWHGTAYDYIRNNYFDANDWFNDYHEFKQPPVRQNDFGGTLGGPVRIPRLYNGNDKTFFFFSYEGLRLMQPQPASTAYVPDLCMLGSVAACQNGRVPAPGELQPPLHAFPAPNGPEYMMVVACDPNTDPACNPATGTKQVQSGLAAYVATWSNPNSLDSTSVRLDHVVSGKLRLFFRYSGTPSSTVIRPSGSSGLSPSTLEPSTSDVRTYTAGATSLLTNRLSNDLRLNYSTNDTTAGFALDSFGGAKSFDLAKAVGMGNTGGVGFGVFSADGAQLALLFQNPGFAAQRQWNLVDTVSLSAGHHQFKFGVDYRRLAPFNLPVDPAVTYYYFDEPSVESNSAFDFIQRDGPAYPLFKNFSLFGEDEWKVSQRLSLSMGLRWDVNPPPGVTQGLMAFTAQGSDPTTWTIAPQGTPLWKTTWFNFAPRLGAAYVIRDKQGWETVLRGGGGLFFDTGQQLGSFGFGGPGFAGFSSDFVGYPTLPTIPPLPDPTKGPLSFGATVFWPHLQLPYTLEWNASVEQALGRAQALTLSYVGSHASRLLQLQRLHVPANTTAQDWYFADNGGASDYDSLQAQFRRRLTRGLTGLGSYTWSHCIDYGSLNFTSGYEKGNCAFDLRHNFSGALSYDLPTAGNNVFARALLNHWGLDDRFTARTGFPVDITGAEFFDPLTGKRESDGVSFVSGQPLYIYGSQCNAAFASLGNTLPCPGGRAINPQAFKPIASGFGDVPRNLARGFGAWQMDLAVRREFPIFENLKLQFRAEAFNVFNHPNFGEVSGSCGGTPGINGCTNPQFGQATATLAQSLGILSQLYQMGGPRSMQFALKLLF